MYSLTMGLKTLERVVARLRSPKGGCPWDRKQTHLSLLKYLREESLEVEEAIKGGRWHDIEDELGDLLFQVVLHAQIAKENGQFDLEDVARSQALKLKRRHPHVFGSMRLKTAAQVLQKWGEVKSRERTLRSRDLKRRAATSKVPKRRR